MPPHSTVLVAGVSGALGTPLARRLAAAGYDVIGISRSPAHSDALRERGIVPIVADALDRDALLRAVRGVRADAVVNLLTALKKTPLRHGDMAMTDRLRTEGTANLMEAARAVGARRVVTESFLKVYGYQDFGDRVLADNASLPKVQPGPFAVHVEAMRSAERQTCEAGIEGIALRLGYLYGPGAGTAEMVAMLRAHRFPVPRNGGGVNSFVHVEDAAAAFAAAIERGRPGAAYNIADDQPVSWARFLGYMADEFDVPAPMRVPSIVLGIFPYAQAILTNSARIGHERAKAELGWTPATATVRDGLASMAAESLGGSASPA